MSTPYVKLSSLSDIDNYRDFLQALLPNQDVAVPHPMFARPDGAGLVRINSRVSQSVRRSDASRQAAVNDAAYDAWLDHVYPPKEAHEE